MSARTSARWTVPPADLGDRPARAWPLAIPSPAGPGEGGATRARGLCRRSPGAEATTPSPSRASASSPPLEAAGVDAASALSCAASVDGLDPILVEPLAALSPLEATQQEAAPELSTAIARTAALLRPTVNSRAALGARADLESGSRPSPSLARALAQASAEGGVPDRLITHAARAVLRSSGALLAPPPLCPLRPLAGWASVGTAPAVAPAALVAVPSPWAAAAAEAASSAALGASLAADSGFDSRASAHGAVAPSDSAALAAEPAILECASTLRADARPLDASAESSARVYSSPDLLDCRISPRSEDLGVPAACGEQVDLLAPASGRVAVSGASSARAGAYLVQAPAGRSRTSVSASPVEHELPPEGRSTVRTAQRLYPLPPEELRGSSVARTTSTLTVRTDTYAARNPLLYNACVAGVGSASTVKLHGLKLYRAVARAVSVAQAVDRVVPVDPLLSTASGRTTAPCAAHDERSLAMFRVAYAAASEGEYDVERLAARVARDYLELAVAPVRALLEELRARVVDAPGIARLAAPAAPAAARSSQAQAKLEAKRAERKNKKILARTQAPQKLIGRRYVVGNARVTVTGYDARTGRWECTTEDGDVVSYSLQELSG